MVKKTINELIRKIGYTSITSPYVGNFFDTLLTRHSQIGQKQLFFHYQSLRQSKKNIPELADTGFRVFSQCDEDGKLLYIFSIIGFTNKICVDIACGRPEGSNVANLIVNWDWTGLLIDDNQDTIDATVNFYKNHDNTHLYPPKVVKKWVNAENINQCLKENGVLNEIDLLSLDVSGVDYWLWKATTQINPRVVLIEYNDIIDASKSITVPYRPDFDRFTFHDYYHGSSLAALVKLGKKKGYRLIGTNNYQFNAIFLRNDIGEKIFRTVNLNSCYSHPKVIKGIKDKWPKVKNMKWENV